MQSPFSVPERQHSSPCEECGGDHPTHTCFWFRDEWENECVDCGEQLIYAANGMAYCPEHGLIDY